MARKDQYAAVLLSVEEVIPRIEGIASSRPPRPAAGEITPADEPAHVFHLAADDKR